MVAVGGDDAVLCDRYLHADGDSLLAIVEVAESADQLGLVELVRGDLHPPHRRHVAEEGHELLRGGIDGARQRIVLVGCEGDAGLDGDGGGVVGEEETAERGCERDGGREGLQKIRRSVSYSHRVRWIACLVSEFFFQLSLSETESD